MKDLYKYINENILDDDIKEGILDDDDIFLDNIEKDIRWTNFVGSKNGYMEVFNELIKINSDIAIEKTKHKNIYYYASPILSKSDDKKDIYVFTVNGRIEKSILVAKGLKTYPIYVVNMYGGLLNHPRISTNISLKRGGIEKVSVFDYGDVTFKCTKLPKEYHWIYDCCEKYINEK